jgi:predicted amidophosphoribosyltransferase
MIIFPLISKNLQLMLFRVCLQCGHKTLTYGNSLCPECNLKISLEHDIEENKVYKQA